MQMITVRCRCCCSAAKSCPTLWDHMDCSLPGSSVHGILQAGTLKRVVISFSRASSQTQGLNPGLLHWQANFFTTEPPGKPNSTHSENYCSKAHRPMILNGRVGGMSTNPLGTFAISGYIFDCCNWGGTYFWNVVGRGHGYCSCNAQDSPLPQLHSKSVVPGIERTYIINSCSVSYYDDVFQSCTSGLSF